MVRLARFHPVATALSGTSRAQLVPDPLEADDERISGEADGDDQTGDTGHVEAVVVRPPEDGDGQVGQQPGEHDGRDRHQAEHAVLGQRVEEDQDETGQAGQQAVAQLLGTQRRADLPRWVWRSKLIGRAPNFNCWARSRAVSMVNPPVMLARPSRMASLKRGATMTFESSVAASWFCRFGEVHHLARDVGVLLGTG